MTKALVSFGLMALALTGAGSGAINATGCVGTIRHVSLKACIVGVATASGDYATTVASGTVTRPSEIELVIDSSRPQLVRVTWSMTCDRGPGAGSRSGSFAIRTFATPGGGMLGERGPWAPKKLSLPMTNADDCSVSAEGQLSASGSIRVVVLGVQRS